MIWFAIQLPGQKPEKEGKMEIPAMIRCKIWLGQEREEHAWHAMQTEGELSVFAETVRIQMYKCTQIFWLFQKLWIMNIVKAFSSGREIFVLFRPFPYSRGFLRIVWRNSDKLSLATLRNTLCCQRRASIFEEFWGRTPTPVGFRDQFSPPSFQIRSDLRPFYTPYSFVVYAYFAYRVMLDVDHMRFE